MQKFLVNNEHYKALTRGRTRTDLFTDRLSGGVVAVGQLRVCSDNNSIDMDFDLDILPGTSS